jgi:hypothetical protein
MPKLSYLASQSVHLKVNQTGSMSAYECVHFLINSGLHNYMILMQEIRSLLARIIQWWNSCKVANEVEDRHHLLSSPVMLSSVCAEVPGRCWPFVFLL